MEQEPTARAEARAERDRALAKLFGALAELAHQAKDLLRAALEAEHENSRRRP